MSGFTPGPWFHHPASGYEHAMGGYVSASADRREAPPVCDVRGSCGQPYEANARLIAAAPELLEALQAITADYKATLGVIARAEGGLVRTGVSDAAEAAIRKATGAAE